MLNIGMARGVADIDSDRSWLMHLGRQASFGAQPEKGSDCRYAVGMSKWAGNIYDAKPGHAALWLPALEPLLLSPCQRSPRCCGLATEVSR